MHTCTHASKSSAREEREKDKMESYIHAISLERLTRNSEMHAETPAAHASELLRRAIEALLLGTRRGLGASCVPYRYASQESVSVWRKIKSQ